MPRLYKRFVEVTLPAFTVDALKISFDVSRQPDETHVNGEVAIFNLSKDREAQVRDRGGNITLRAGYGEAIATLFDGAMGRVIRERRPLARITRIELLGASSPAVESEKNKGLTVRSYAGSQTVWQVATDIISDMGLQAGPLDAIPEDATVENWAWAAESNEALRRLLKRVDVSWYEDDGIVRFNSAESVQADAPTIFLSPDTGLIGAPALTDEGAQLTSFLKPLARVGGIVDLESETLTGKWKIAGIQHRGDSWDGSFETIFDVRELE